MQNEEFKQSSLMSVNNQIILITLKKINDILVIIEYCIYDFPNRRIFFSHYAKIKQWQKYLTLHLRCALKSPIPRTISTFFLNKLRKEKKKKEEEEEEEELKRKPRKPTIET